MSIVISRFSIVKSLSPVAKLGHNLNKKKFIHTSFIRNKAKLIDGRNIANTILSELKQETDEWVAQGNRRPQLTAILVGEDPASTTYVKNKMKAAKQVGIKTRTIHCLTTISEKDLLQHIHLLNNDPEVDGILVQVNLVTPDSCRFRTTSPNEPSATPSPRPRMSMVLILSTSVAFAWT
uniref:Tetrahydrofolate dehydrogenase/cyclohydrolase catalytic domain-containing protein n=1 Tax=Homalodisca liturata TaxID=320908 RepID=A0A1B6I4X8_9HEMI